jgi:hypothetical protein
MLLVLTSPVVAIAAASMVTALCCHMPNAEELGVVVFGNRDRPARNFAEFA